MKKIFLEVASKQSFFRVRIKKKTFRGKKKILSKKKSILKKKFISKMANCCNSDNYENDLKVEFDMAHDFSNYTMNDLAFCKAEDNENDIIINIADFVVDRVSTVEAENRNFKVFYNAEPFKIKIKVFSGIIKRGKNYIRNIYVKVMNHITKIKIGKYFML